MTQPAQALRSDVTGHRRRRRGTQTDYQLSAPLLLPGCPSVASLRSRCSSRAPGVVPDSSPLLPQQQVSEGLLPAHSASLLHCPRSQRGPSLLSWVSAGHSQLVSVVPSPPPSHPSSTAGPRVRSPRGSLRPRLGPQRSEWPASSFQSFFPPLAAAVVLVPAAPASPTPLSCRLNFITLFVSVRARRTFFLSFMNLFTY